MGQKTGHFLEDFEDGLIVFLAEAGGDAGAEELGVEGAQGQRSICASAQIQDEIDVLEMLGEPGLGSEIALDHFVPFEVHHARIGRSLF